MYAGDLLLLSISLSDMQALVNLCVKEFYQLGMEVNVNKSACLRIGARFKATTMPITIGNESLIFKQEITYLGLKLGSGQKFTINQHNLKQKFFRQLNSIFGKVGLNTSPVVLCTLIETFSVSSMLYTSESILWTI